MWGVTFPAVPLLEIEQLKRTYDAARPVLRGVDLAINAGERVAILGPSGCGKTTLLHCIAGIDTPDAGRITLKGEDVIAGTEKTHARLRREALGMVFQFFHLLPTLTAFENAELPLKLLGVPAVERRMRVQALIDRVGLGSRANALPGQLSGGEMQRVAIARALIHKPALILADEPTGNLDSVTGETVLGLLRDVTEAQGTGLLMVTHSAEAAGICHRILRMKDGRIVDA